MDQYTRKMRVSKCICTVPGVHRNVCVCVCVYINIKYGVDVRTHAHECAAICLDRLTQPQNACILFNPLAPEFPFKF